MINKMKTLLFTLLIVFNFLIPFKIYALTVEENIKILKDPKSTNELIIIGNLGKLSSLSSNKIQESFYKIYEYSSKYLNNEFSVDEFKLLSSKEIDECKLQIDKFINNRLLIPNSSTSKFSKVRKFYSDIQKYYDKIEIINKQQLTFIENLVNFAVVLDIENFDKTMIKFRLNSIDLNDFDADFKTLSLQMTPETTLDSKIVPISIINTKAIANLERMNVKIMDDNIDYKQLETLHLQTLDIYKNSSTLRNDFYSNLVNLEKKFFNIIKKSNSSKKNQFNKIANEIFTTGQNLIDKYTLLEFNIIRISKFTLNNYSSIFDKNKIEYDNFYLEHEKIVLLSQELELQLREKYKQLVRLIQTK
jgi:hypothetical protein